MIEDILAEITPPSSVQSVTEEIVVPAFSDIRLDGESCPKDIFAVQSRKSWDKSMEARCDFQYHLRMTRRASTNFITIWQSEKAEEVRQKVRRCPKNCWMVGTASPVMHKYIKHPLRWALKNKWRSMRGLPPCLDKTWCDVGQDPCQGDLKMRH